MDEKQLQFLFDNYGKSKGFKDFNEFKSLMQNEGSRKVFFDDSNKDLGFKDYNDFEVTIGVKKKDGGQITSTTTSPTQSPSNPPLQLEEEIPKKAFYITKDGISIPNNVVTLSKKAIELQNRKKLSQTGGIGGMAMGTTTSTEVDDEDLKKESEAIRNEIKNQGYDADKLFEQYRDVPESISRMEGFRPEDEELNPQNHSRKLATASWQTNLTKALEDKVNVGELPEEEYNNFKKFISDAQSGGRTYKYKREDTRAIISLIDKNVEDEGLRSRLKKAVAIDRAYSYGQDITMDKDKELAESPESKYLDKDETLAYQYLKDTDPEVAKGYDAVFVDSKKLDDNEKVGWEEKMSRLKTIGVKLQQNAVQEEINSLYKNVIATSPQQELSPEQLKRYNDLIEKKNQLDEESSSIALKYQTPARYEIEDITRELIGNQAIESSKAGGLLYLLGKTGSAFEKTWQGIWDLVSEPFRSDEGSKMNQLAAAGQLTKESSVFGLPQKKTSLQSFEIKVKPELKERLVEITHNKDLSYEDKYKQVYTLLKDNPGAYGKFPISGGKLNVNPTTLFYSVGELAATIAPYIAMEAATGGGATASIGRKILSSFTSAASTMFRDSYATAVKDGSGNPFAHALRTTAISSAFMAGAGTPQIIKKMLGTKTAVGEMVNSMTDDAINAVLKEKNKISKFFGRTVVDSKGNPINAWKPLKDMGKGVLEAAKEGLEGGAKFETVMGGGELINQSLDNKEIDVPQMVKKMIVGTLSFGAFGTVMGSRGQFKKINELESGSLLKASANPEGFISAATEMLKDGEITREKYDQIVENIKLANEVGKKIKYVGNNGKELSEGKKGKLLLLKIEQRKLEEKMNEDFPTLIKEKTEKELEEVKDEIEDLYVTKKEDELPEQEKVSVGGDVNEVSKTAINNFIEGKTKSFEYLEDGNGLSLSLSDEHIANAGGTKLGEIKEGDNQTSVKLNSLEVKEYRRIEADKELGDITTEEYNTAKRELSKKVFKRLLSEQSLKETPKADIVGEVKAELPDTYIINGKPVSEQEFDTAIENAKNTKEKLDVEYNGDDEVRIQKIIDLGGSTENGKTVIAEEVPEQKSSVKQEVKRIVEPTKTISEMNSEEMSDFATETRKALKKQDKEFEGKTEQEKEESGYYDIIDDVEDLRDAAERINFIENAENVNDLANSVKSTLSTMRGGSPNEYQLAILNSAKNKAIELGIGAEDLIKKISTKIASEYRDIEDAEFMVRNAIEKLIPKNEPKAAELPKQKNTNESPTTEVTKPVQQDAGVPAQQGTKEAVSKSTEPIGQGNAETKVPVLRKKKEEKIYTANALKRVDAKKIYQKIQEMDAPSSADQIALEYLAMGGEVNESSIDEIAGSVKRASLNTGARELKSNESKARAYSSKKAKTLDEIAHSLWEFNNQEVSERDIKDALMDAVGSFNNRLDAAKEYLERYSAEYQEEKQQEIFQQQYAREIEEEEKNIQEWLEKEGEYEIEVMNDNDYVTNLIQKYEAETKGEDKQPASKTETKTNKGISINGGSEKTTKPNATTSPTVEQLRLQEQAEYDAMPNPKDEAERKRIYDKYDKLISPLLDEGEVKAEVPKPKTKQQELADKARSLKINLGKLSGGGLQSNVLGLPIAVYNGAIEIIARALETGSSLTQAINQAYKKLKLKERKEFNQAEFIKQLEDATGEKFVDEAEVPPPSEPPVDKTKESEIKIVEDIEEQDLSGIRKKLVSDEIIKGVDLDRISDKEMMGLGRKILDSGEVKPEAIVTKIITEGKGVLTPTEVVALITYKRDIDNQLSDVYKKINEKKSAKEDIGTLGVEAKSLERQINDFDVMAVITAQQQSMAFRLRQRMLDRDYNVVTQIEKYKSVNNGEIPEEVESKLRELDKQLKEVKEKLVEAEKKIQEKEAQDAVNNIKESVDREKSYTDEELNKKIEEEVESEISKLYEELPEQKRSAADKAIKALEKFRVKLKSRAYESTLGIPIALADLGAVTAIRAIKIGKTVSEAVEIGINRIKKSLKEKGIDKWDQESEYRKDLSDTLEAEGVSTKNKIKDKPVINKDGTVTIPNDMLRDLVKRGVTDINDLVDEVHSKLVQELPEITKRQVRDYITGYGKTVNPTSDKLQTQINTAKRVGRLLSELEDLKKMGEVEFLAKYQKTKPSKNKILERERELKRQIKSLSKDIADIDNTKTDEERLILTKESVTRRIDELKRKIKNKDFSKNKKNQSVTDSELVELNKQKEKIQAEFDDLQYQNELKNRGTWQKVEDAAYEATSGLLRGLTLSLDMSAGLVQGMRKLFTNPGKSVKAFVESIKHLVSEKYSEDYLAKHKAQSYFPLIKASKLAIDDKSGKVSVKEGMFISNWINLVWDKLVSPVIGFGTKKGTSLVRKINPYLASQRAYDGYVNSIRIQSFLQIAKQIENDGYTFESNPEVFKKAADFVNTTTGRGSLGQADANSKWLNIFLTAPRKVISELKLYTPYALVYYSRMPKAVRKKAFLDFAKFATSFITTNALIWAATKNWDDEEEDKKDNFWNPNSSDFLTHKIGDNRISVAGGMKSIINFQSRFITGEFTDQYGKTTKLGERFGKDINTRFDLLTRFITGKSAPAFNVALKKLDERKGKEMSNEEIIKSLTVPLWMQDIKELYKDDPATVGAFLTAMSILGANVRSVEKSKSDIDKEELSKNPKLKYFIDKGYNFPEMNPEKIQTKEINNKVVERLSQYDDKTQKLYIETKKKHLADELEKLKNGHKIIYVDNEGGVSLTSSYNNKPKQFKDATKEQVQYIIINIIGSAISKKLKKDILEKKKPISKIKN